METTMSNLNTTIHKIRLDNKYFTTSNDCLVSDINSLLNQPGKLKQFKEVIFGTKGFWLDLEETKELIELSRPHLITLLKSVSLGTKVFISHKDENRTFEIRLKQGELKVIECEFFRDFE